MKGFFRRDLYLILVSAKFYVVFILGIGIISALGKMGTGFMGLYLMIFVSSVLLGQFNYDEQNGWGAYAAAIPDGRRAQVDARYLLSLAVVAAATALETAVCMLSGEADGPVLAALYAGMMLVYAALLFPLTYRFGNRSRFIMLFVIVLVGAGGGVGSSLVMMPGGLGNHKSALAVAAGVLLPLGMVSMAVSHRVSVGIMRRKEW